MKDFINRFGSNKESGDNGGLAASGMFASCIGSVPFRHLRLKTKRHIPPLQGLPGAPSARLVAG